MALDFSKDGVLVDAPDFSGFGTLVDEPAKPAARGLVSAKADSSAADAKARKIAEMDEETDPSNPNYLPITKTAQSALRTDARGGMDAKRTKGQGRVLDADIPGTTVGSVAQDIGAGALQIGPTVVKGVGDITRMLVNERAGKAISKFAEDGNKSIQEVVGSERGNLQRQRFDQDMQDKGLNPADLIVGNPGAISDMVLPTVGSMYLPVGVSAAAGAAAKAGNAAKLAAAIDPATVAARAATASEAAVIATTAAQNAADTYGNILDKGGSKEDAYRGAVMAGGVAALVGKATGGGAEGELARIVGGKSIMKGVREVPKAVAKEAGQEVGEQVGQSFGELSGNGEMFDANKFGKELAVSGTLGAVVGGGANAVSQATSIATERLPGREQAVTGNPVPPAPVDPVAAVMKTENVEQAILAAQTSVAAVDNIGQILQAQGLMTRPPVAPDIAAVTQSITELENANVGTRPAIQPVPATTAGSGMPEPGVSLEAGLGTDRTAGPAVDTGNILNQPTGDFVPLAAGTRLDAVDANNVQNAPPRANPEAQAQAVETPKAGAPDATGTTSAGSQSGSTGVEAAGVEPALTGKAKWLKAINDQNRMQPAGGVQLTVTPEGKLNFMGNPDATKQGRALASTLQEAIKAGATTEEIAASINGTKKANLPAVQKLTPAAPTGLKVTFGGKSYPVDSINDAQAKWVEFRDQSGGGVSDVGNGVPVTDQSGKLIARISYNGRAWDSDKDNANLMAEAPEDRTPMPEGVNAITAQGYIPPRETLEQVIARGNKAAADAKPADQRLIPVSKRTPEAAPAQEIQAQAAPENVAPDLAGARAELAELEKKRKLVRSSKRADIDGQIERLKDTIYEMETAMDKTPAADIRLGRDNQPIHRGGKPYTLQRDAKKVQRKQPIMRVVRVEGGFALAEKTPAQLAAEKAGARRLRNPNTGPAGEPISAHAFIAAEGRLSADTRADMNMGDNPRIGNRTLFAGAGQGGLTMEQATERLIEEGYLPEDASHNDAMALIKRSLNDPQYNPDGVERMAEKEAAQREAAHHAEQEAIAVHQELEDNQFADAADAYELAMRDYPADVKQSDMSREDAFLAMGFTEQEYQNAVAEESRGPQSSSEGSPGPAEVAAGAGAQSNSGREGAPGSDSRSGSEAASVAPAARIPKEIIDLGFKLQPATRTGGAQNSATWTSSETAPYTRISIAHTPNPDTYRVTVGGRFVAPMGENALPTYELGQYKSIDTLLAAIKPVMEKAAPASEGLSAPSRQDILDQQQRKQDADKAEAKAKAAADKKDKADRDAADIKIAGANAADRFVLGGNAEDELSGQGGMFDAPEAPAPAPAPGKSAEVLRAEADLANALADLGDIFGSGSRLNMMPEQQQKILPVLVKLFDAAFRMGYYKFKDAAKFALDKIRAALGNEVADALTLDQLQGAYISLGKRDNGDTKRQVVDVEEKSEIESHTAKVDNLFQEQSNVPSPDAGVERNSQRPGTQPAVGNPVPNDAGPVAAGTGEAGGRANRGTGRGQQDSAGVPAGSAAVDRERGDQLIRGGGQPTGPQSSDARTDFGERSGDSGITGIPPDAIATKEVDAVATRGDADLKKRQEQLAASKLSVVSGDLQNIRDTLPYLLPDQHVDVQKAEAIFAKPTGYGMLFTNGTGTGKTFSGLGIIKRFAMQGKTNTLIVLPDNKIAADWITSGKALGLNITQLDDTTQAGEGIVLTTYANMGANDSLATRKWDLIVPDEAHMLLQAADGIPTSYLINLRALTHHPDGKVQRYTMLNRPDIERYSELDKEITANSKIINKDDTMDVMRQSLQAANKKLEAEQAPLRVKLQKAREAVNADIEAMQGEKRTRLTFLSATPFAYEKTVPWANGYLFDYMDGYPYDPLRAGINYNQPNPYQYFMMTRFGYVMKTNKLNAPGPKVDSGLMQRQFNAELKKKGVLSGRMLDVKFDYDRRFVLIDSAIGNKIDEALEWLVDKARAFADAQKNISDIDKEGNNGMATLRDTIADQFDYLSRRYLLEAVKAEAVIPIVKAHIAMGRSVVVFHDYNKGGSSNPFDVTENAIPADTDEKTALRARSYNQAVREFRASFPELATGLNNLLSPIDLFKRQMPETMLINGKEKERDVLQRYLDIQDDTKGPQVMLVQSDKNKGWSGHDTTGVHQRVLINLGQPTAPTKAIQQEGRIYRTGQASNAIMRYLNTGTSWERMAFATTIASRSSVAENLGMGEQARALKDSFIAAFEESDTFAPGHEGEGTGGKARDKASNKTITEYDRAKTFYYATGKKNSKTKAQEGVDYYATPEPVGLKMVQFLDPQAGEALLEPSGGHGAIARWMPETTTKTVIEPSATLRSRMALVMDPPPATKIIDGTFEDLNVVNKFDGIAMNPPFGSGGKTAIDHLAKAATHLREGGRIVALIPTGPAADKKFDKWFYEASEKPTKPLGGTGKHGPIYRGDTVTIEGFGTSYDIVAEYIDGPASGAQYIRAKGTSKDGGINTIAISKVTPTGPRTESFRAVADLQMVAEIKLPSVTFERAGTAVNTRIVVLEKVSKSAVDTRGVYNRDYTDITDINDLFDALENVVLPTRANPQAPAEPVKASAKAPKPEAAPAPAAAVGETITVDGKPYAVAIYTTNAGKELRGVWVPTRAIALSHGPSTFEKRGLGFFIRERDFPKQPAAGDAPMFSRASNTTWRSALRDGIDGINAKALTGNMWADGIKGLINKGTAKADEVEWSGITDWLKLQEGKVSKEQVLDYLDGNGVKIEETVLGKKPVLDTIARDMGFGGWSSNLTSEQEQAVIEESKKYDHLGDNTKYGDRVLPGGENYKELLLTLPTLAPKNPGTPAFQVIGAFPHETKSRAAAQEYIDRLTELAKTTPGIAEQLKQFPLSINEYAEGRIEGNNYKSSHWSQPNILAHIRFNERTDSTGAKVLFIEEVQSDFGADYRKSKDAINKAVDDDFEGIIKRMEKAGVLEVNCD